MKILKNFFKEGLKSEISQINIQLHKTNKKKIKKIYSELEKFTAEELNDFFDLELFNFVESTQELLESNKIAIRLFLNLDANKYDYPDNIHLHRQMLPIAYTAALKTGYKLPQIEEDKNSILNGNPIDYEKAEMISLFVKTDSHFANKLKNTRYTSNEIFNFYYSGNCSVFEYCKAPDVLIINSVYDMRICFFEYDVRQIEVLSKFITDNPQMKISLEKLDFKELSYIYIDNLCNVLLDKNLFSRLVLNDIQKERLIDWISIR